MKKDGNIYQWQGREVRVYTRFIPWFLGLTASIDVSVDGKRVLATGGRFRRGDRQKAAFDGGMHLMELEWMAGWGRPRYLQPFDYTLSIDGVVVGQSTVHHNTVPAAALISALIIGALLFWVNQKTGASFQDIGRRLDGK